MTRKKKSNKGTSTGGYGWGLFAKTLAVQNEVRKVEENISFKSGVSLEKLEKENSHFIEWEQMFFGAWEKDNVSDLKVETMYKIHPSQEQKAAYANYADAIALNGSVQPERYLFHGTVSDCNVVGNPQEPKFCKQDESCSLCGIMTHFFRKEYIGRNKRGDTFQRLGNGFYFSSKSSKCHFYSKLGQRPIMQSPCYRYGRVMLLCKVCSGNIYTPNRSGHWIEPPQGYDSIMGVVGRFSGLNYDEMAVYNSAACLPVALIVYSFATTTE